MAGPTGGGEFPAALAAALSLVWMEVGSYGSRASAAAAAVAAAAASAALVASVAA